MAAPIVIHPEVAPSPNPSSLTPVQQALRKFSDLLFEVQDKLKEGTYKELQDAAQQVYSARLEAPRPSRQLTTSYDDLVTLMREHFADHRSEIEHYQEQLSAATIRIDHLCEERGVCAKTTRALKDVCDAHNIPDSVVLEAYHKTGGDALVNKVLEIRETNKRKRDAEAVRRGPPSAQHVADAIQIHDSDSDSGGDERDD